MTGVTETQDVRAVVDLALRRPALVLIVVQALLILALLTQRARKRKAEAVVRESEKRFRVMTDTTPSMVLGTLWRRESPPHRTLKPA